MTTRPIQEMSYLSASVRAAKEVQADTLSPDFFRQAMEWYSKARREYKIKNFSLAQEYAVKARYFAEQAEFDALKHGGVRSEVNSGPPQGSSTAPPSPYPYPTPTATPAEGADASGGGQPAAPPTTNSGGSIPPSSVPSPSP